MKKKLMVDMTSEERRKWTKMKTNTMRRVLENDGA